MTIKIGINGFGRIGRMVFRAAVQNFSEIEVVAINDLLEPEYLAYMLQYDSVHGRFKGTIAVDGNTLLVNGKRIRLTQEKDPANLKWGDVGATVVIESTGLFLTKESGQKHLDAGAKKVILSAPSKDDTPMFVYGVNDKSYKGEAIISNASCTTNCLAPVAKVLNETFGIVSGIMTTIHSYTNDQQILDLPHKDLRRARAAALSMIPTTTGAAKALKEVLPAMAGKLDGMAIRVPTPNVSLVDLTVRLERKATAHEVNDAFRAAAAGPLKGILAVVDEPLVSCDYNGDRHSSSVDSALTTVVGDQVKVLSWYDNEMGYSQRLLDLTRFIAEKLGA